MWECVFMHFTALPCFGRSIMFPCEPVLGWRDDTQTPGWVNRLARTRAQLSGKELFSPGERPQKLSAQRITLDIDFAESCLKRISRRGETKSSWIQKKTPTYLNASRMALCKVQPQISYSHSYELYVSFVLFFIRKWECFPTDKTKGQYFQYQPVYWCSCVYKLCILLFLWSYFNFIFWHILSGHLLQ